MDDLPKLISEMLTDDPDVFDDAGMDKPMSDMEINKQAQQGMPSADASEPVAAQMKAQRDLEQTENTQRQRLLQPQFKALNQSMDKLNAGVLQGQQTATNSDQQLVALQKDLGQINTLLGGLESSMK